MDSVRDYFLCSKCQNKDFQRIYNFSIRFHGVNFSDELMYDKLTDEILQCTTCGKTFTTDQVERKLAEFRKRRKSRT
jgi:hypothetical protein